MSRVQLFSGGLDSLALWFLAGRPRPVYVCVAAPYEAAERDVLLDLACLIDGFDPLFLDGPDLSGVVAADGHIPVRNLLLAAVAVARTGASEVVLGALLGEASPDKSRRFLKAASAALSASEGRQIRVAAPAHRWTKTGLLRRFVAAHPEEAHLIETTRSCYGGGAEPCGECQACFRRDVALWHAGLSDRRPRPPSTATARAGLAALRGAGVRRLPALAVNNALAVLAVAGVRPPRHRR